MVAAIPVSPRFPEISLLSGLLPSSDLSRRLEARKEIRSTPPPLFFGEVFEDRHDFAIAKVNVPCLKDPFP